MIDWLVLNIRLVVFQLYSGGEPKKKYAEKREGWSNWGNNFWLSLKKYGELGRDEKI